MQRTTATIPDHKAHAHNANLVSGDAILASSRGDHARKHWPAFRRSTINKLSSNFK